MRQLKLLLSVQFFFLSLYINSINCQAQNAVFEAEEGKAYRTNVDMARSGFSGSGYVTGFKNKKDALDILVNVVSDGLYNLSIRYASSHGPQSYCIYVNDDALGSRSFTKSLSFTDLAIGKILLNAGSNLIRLEKDWNYFDLDSSYFDVDYITVQIAQPTRERIISKTLVTSDPSEEATRVMSYLIDMSGQKTLSGQQGNDDELKYIEQLTGRRPAIRGFDLLNYSTAISWDDGTTDNIIKWFYEENGIPTVCWHWFSPSGKKGDKSFYYSETDFNFEKALDERQQDSVLLMKDIDLIAAQLKRLEDAGVPVLWRPLHEASSPAFWWGARGHAAYIRLYKLLFNRLTQHHELKNLIWVWTTYDDGEASTWYPGPEYVDIISTDIYLDSNKYQLSTTVYDNLASRYPDKLVTLSENGLIPDPDKLKNEKASWSWFCTWNGEFIINSEINSAELIRKLYNHEYVVTLDELPKFSGQFFGAKALIWKRATWIMICAFSILSIAFIGKVTILKFKK